MVNGGRLMVDHEPGYIVQFVEWLFFSFQHMVALKPNVGSWQPLSYRILGDSWCSFFKWFIILV